MNSINTDALSSIVQKNLLSSVGQHNDKVVKNNQLTDNAGACLMNPDVAQKYSNFELSTDNIAAFKDMISTAQNSLSLIQIQAQSIHSLISKAQGGERGSDFINSINSEIADKINEINKIFQETEFNGINPLASSFGITIPDWQDYIKGAEKSEETENEETPESAIKDVLADINFDFDMSAVMDGQEINMKASANIQIGFTEDGALQITVDAALDYDLSGIMSEGAESPNALDIINRFLELISGKQNSLGYANQLMDNIFNKATNYADAFMGLELPENSDGSTAIQGQMVQHATITLDNANQMPNIAINLL